MKSLKEKFYDNNLNIITQLSSEMKKYVSNTGYMFFGKIINRVLSLVVGIYVARYLGPEDYGLLSYAQSFVSLFGVFVGLGLNDILVRELVNNPENENVLLGTAFSLKIAVGSFVTLIVIALGILINDDKTTQYLIIICSGTIFFQFAKVFDYWFQAKVLAKYSEIANVITFILVSLLKVAFIILSLSVIFFAIAILVSSLIRLLLLGWQFVRREEKFKPLNFNYNIAKNLLKDSWPLIISGLNIIIAMKIDQIMIKEMLDASSVGIYAVGVKLADSASFLPVIVATSLFPKLVELNGTQRFWTRYGQIFKYFLWPFIGIAIIIGVSSESIIQFLFGHEYINAWPVLVIYIWTLPLSFIGIMTNKYLLLINKTKAIFFRQLLVGSLNITLNLFLIVKFGIIGAAFSTVIPQLVVNIFYDFYDKDLRQVLFVKLNTLSFGIFKIER